MGRAYDAWGRIKTAWIDHDSDLLWEQYAPNGVYLETLNPPHEGRDLIRSYVDDFTSARPNITMEDVRVIDGGDAVCVEWLFSYDQPNRRVTNLRRCSIPTVNAEGQVLYHRDYT